MQKTFLLILFSFIVIIISKENSLYYNEDPDAYRGRAFSESESCNSMNCPSPNSCGTHEGVEFCVCDKKFANYPFIGYNNQYCTYKRRKQIVGFLWELLTNVGIGHYYIGKIVRGLFKTLVLITPIAIFLLGKFKLVQVGFDLGLTGKIMSGVMCAFFLCSFIWWIVDAIMFGRNKYRDNNDVPLKHW